MLRDNSVPGGMLGHVSFVSVSRTPCSKDVVVLAFHCDRSRAGDDWRCWNKYKLNDSSRQDDDTVKLYRPCWVDQSDVISRVGADSP